MSSVKWSIIDDPSDAKKYWDLNWEGSDVGWIERDKDNLRKYSLVVYNQNSDGTSGEWKLLPSSYATLKKAKEELIGVFT